MYILPTLLTTLSVDLERVYQVQHPVYLFATSSDSLAGTPVLCDQAPAYRCRLFLLSTQWTPGDACNEPSVSFIVRTLQMLLPLPGMLYFPSLLFLLPFLWLTCSLVSCASAFCFRPPPEKTSCILDCADQARCWLSALVPFSGGTCYIVVVVCFLISVHL